MINYIEAVGRSKRKMGKK